MVSDAALFCDSQNWADDGQISKAQSSPNRWYYSQGHSVLGRNNF